MKEVNTDTNTKKIAASAKAKKEETLLDAMHKVLQKSDNCELGAQYYKNAKTDLAVINDKLGTNDAEATVLTVIVNESSMGCCDDADICRHLDINGLQRMTLDETIKGLVNKKLIFQIEERRGRRTYDIPEDLRKAITANKAYSKPSSHCDDEREFFVHLDQLFSQKDDSLISTDSLCNECHTLLEENEHLDFVKNYKEVAGGLEGVDNVMVLLFCIQRFRGCNKPMSPRNWGFIFDTSFARDMMANDIRAGKSKLVTMKILKKYDSEDLLVDNEFVLSNACIKKLFPDQILKEAYVPNNSNVVKSGSIVTKKLFYNRDVQTMVDSLTDLLEPKQLGKVQARMKKAGMKTGLCCLFYGDAGAGKTELVRQLARSTGRDLMQIDLSQMRSKWVGDSEKNIQQVFDEYKVLLRRSKRQPILLFNEADAIMNKRIASPERSVDKMENTMANIILQNMEDFEDGILIATTNLASTNLDPAYERRFLYKIEFGRPNAEVRFQIWHSMLSDVDEEVLQRLSKEYEFTGGQIANIQKKKLVDEILTGKQHGYEELKEYCEQEHIAGTKHQHIGFGR